MPFLSEVASVNADVAGLSSIGTHPNVCRDAPLIAHLRLTLLLTGQDRGDVISLLKTPAGLGLFGRSKAARTVDTSPPPTMVAATNDGVDFAGA